MSPNWAQVLFLLIIEEQDTIGLKVKRRHNWSTSHKNKTQWGLQLQEQGKIKYIPNLLRLDYAHSCKQIAPLRQKSVQSMWFCLSTWKFQLIWSPDQKWPMWLNVGQALYNSRSVVLVVLSTIWRSFIWIHSSIQSVEIKSKHWLLLI